MKDLIKGKAKSARVRCEKCSHSWSQEFQQVDADLLVKAVGTFSQAAPRLASKEDATSSKVIKLNADISEMSSNELAERIIALEEQLAEEGD